MNARPSLNAGAGSPKEFLGDETERPAAEHDTEKIMRQMWNKDVCDGSGCGRCPTCPASKEQESE